jgi:voltage-gated potassium channel
MIVVHQASAVLILVTLTLVSQSAGMAALIEWVKAHLFRGIHRFGTLRSAVLVSHGHPRGFRQRRATDRGLKRGR